MGAQRWFKGNNHAHTRESDGDADPEAVVKWYREHAYDFLVLADHNHLTILDDGSDPANAPGLLMIPGEELTLAVVPQ